MVTHRTAATPLETSRWRNAIWLILAPHADDETIGCGALIAQTAAAGQLGAIVFMTDSAASHPADNAAEKKKLAAIRRREAKHAIRLLSRSAPAPLFLGWPDANPYPSESRQFMSAVARLADVCHRHRVNAIAVTGRNEPHCDHVAAYQIAVAAQHRALRPVDIFEYMVWSPDRPGASKVLRTRPLATALRNRALAQHRSQTTPLHGNGFRVPRHMHRVAPSDLLFYRERR